MKFASRIPMLFASCFVAILLASFDERSVGGPGPSQQTPSPGPEMQKFMQALSGHWSIRDVSESTPRHPKGVTAVGTEVWRSEPGGMPFVEEYHSKGPDGEQFDSAFFWQDATKQIRGLWCAQLNEEGCSPFVVHWEGRQIVMSGEFQGSKKKYAWRETFLMDGVDAFTQTLEQGESGGRLAQAATIHARRVK